MRVLVYHAGGLGDFVTILPLLRWFRAGHPGAEMAFLGPLRHGQLGQACGYFGQTWDLDAGHFAGLFGDTPDAALLRRFAGMDTAIAFAAPDSPLLRHLRNLRLLHQPPFPDGGRHVVDYHLSLVDTTGISDEERRPAIALRGHHGRGDQVVIHPGSGSAAKNWPLERFVELGRRLTQQGRRVVWVLGEAEAGMDVPPAHEVLRLPPLLDLAAALAGCGLYIGNDSGVSHLAAAVGSATVALFGPSDAAVWAPRSSRVEVVVSADRTMEGIGVDAVWEAVTRLLR